MGEEEDDAIYIIFNNKRPKAVNAQKKKKKKKKIGDDRLSAALSLEMNEGKREHLCLSMSPTQKASSVLQRFGLDEYNSTIIISGAEASYVLEERLGGFPKDENGILQMTIKPREIEDDGIRFLKDEDRRICLLGSRCMPYMACIII